MIRRIVSLLLLSTSLLFFVLAAWLMTMRPDFAVLMCSIVLGSFDRAGIILFAVSAGAALALFLVAPHNHRRRRKAAFVIVGLCVVSTIAVRIRGAAAYSRETVTFQANSGMLEGTLYRPRGKAVLPGVIIVPGSGNKKRQIYHVLADRIARAGFVVLNADKRGVGGSSGSYETIGEQNADPVPAFEERSQDVVSAVEYMRHVRGVDSTKIGLWAVSQGGWIVPIVVQARPNLAFAVVVSGPAVSTGEEKRFSRLTKDEDDHFGYRPPPITNSALRDSMAHVTASGFDPRPYQPQLRLPTLWMYGEWDNSVPVERSVARLDSLRTAGPPMTTHVFKMANHGLMIARGPEKRTLPYFAPGVWTTMIDWMKEATR